jgi:hypothetical protein
MRSKLLMATPFYQKFILLKSHIEKVMITVSNVPKSVIVHMANRYTSVSQPFSLSGTLLVNKTSCGTL